jgi:hypothetical protein
MASMLRVDHDGDLINQYAQAFRVKHLFRAFPTQYGQHSLYEAIDGNVTQQNVDSLLQNNTIDYVSGSGHGKYNMFIGGDGNAIWETGAQNVDLLKGKIVHLLACDAGASLGKEAIQRGAITFWGYTASFLFAHQASPPSLEDDSVAEIFLKMDIIIDRGVLAGANGNEIYESITRYVVQLIPSLTAFDRSLLLSNYYNLASPAVTWGDPTATIS